MTTPGPTTPGPTTPGPTTPAATPERPSDPAAAALYDALANEHAAIYAYGIVSARSTPEDNWLVAQDIARHRSQRESLIVMLESLSVAPPLAAPGYQLPTVVNDPTEAAQLAVQMENDSAVAWRAVLEQATSEQDRKFAVEALTQSAISAARWQTILGVFPITVAFPGGPE